MNPETQAVEGEYVPYAPREPRPILHALRRVHGVCDAELGIAPPAEYKQFIGSRCPTCRRRVHVVAWHGGYWRAA